MATYVSNSSINNGDLTLTESYKYGSALLGINTQLVNVEAIDPVYVHIRGLDGYILMDHLGNTRATISDKKLQVEDPMNPGQILYYEADVKAAYYYSAYGAISNKYGSDPVVAFNGQRKSGEIGENAQTALFWVYNGDVGRRWNVDPKPVKGLSLYSTFKNNPISMVDINGDTTEIRNSKGEYLGTHWGKKGNYLLMLNKRNEKRWEKWRETNFRELNEKNLSDEEFLTYATKQGNVYDINSVKLFYSNNVGKGTVDKIDGAPISEMTDIYINNKKSTREGLRKIIKSEGIGPEWGGMWAKNKNGIYQIVNIVEGNDLVRFPTGPHLAHFHPNPSKSYIITFNYKLAGEKLLRSGYAEIHPYAPVSLVDIEEGKIWGETFPDDWNTVVEKNAIWFYNGQYERFKIRF